MKKKEMSNTFGEKRYDFIIFILFVSIVFPIFLTKIVYPDRIPRRYIKEHSIDANETIIQLQSIGTFDGMELNYDINTYVIYVIIHNKRKQYIDIYGNLCRYNLNTREIVDVVSGKTIFRINGQ